MRKSKSFENMNTNEKNIPSPKTIETVLERARNGDVEAQTTLGKYYEQGLGVPRDYQEALKWYLLAAEFGSAMAMLAMCEMYRRGLGVPKNEVKHAEWIKKYENQAGASKTLVSAMKELENRQTKQKLAEDGDGSGYVRVRSE